MNFWRHAHGIFRPRETKLDRAKKNIPTQRASDWISDEVADGRYARIFPRAAGGEREREIHARVQDCTAVRRSRIGGDLEWGNRWCGIAVERAARMY